LEGDPTEGVWLNEKEEVEDFFGQLWAIPKSSSSLGFLEPQQRGSPMGSYAWFIRIW